MFETLAGPGALSRWQAWEAGDSDLLVTVVVGAAMNGAAALQRGTALASC